MMHWKAIWKPGITEITKGSRGFPGPYKGSGRGGGGGGGGGGGFTTPYMNLQLHEAIELIHTGLWPIAIKLDPYEKKRSA